MTDVSPPGMSRTEASGRWPTEPIWWDRVHTLAGGVAADGVAWPLLLTPTALDPAWAPPRGALLVHQDLSWCAAPHRHRAATFGSTVEWVSARGGTVETGRRTVARDGGSVAAATLHVVRHSGEAQTHGTRPRLSVPEDAPGGGTVEETIVIPRADVLAYAELSGSPHAVHTDVDFARSLGHRDVLVQGALLIMRHVAETAGEDPVGRVRAWFRAPVAAGTEIEVGRSGRRRVYRAPGSDLPAVVIDMTGGDT